MDEEDDSAAWAHQIELEQRQQLEEAIARGRRLLAENRQRAIEIEREGETHHARVLELTRTSGAIEL